MSPFSSNAAQKPKAVTLLSTTSSGGEVTITWEPSFDEYGDLQDIILKYAFNGRNYTNIPQHRYHSWTIFNVNVPSTVTFQLQAVSACGEIGLITRGEHTTSGQNITTSSICTLESVLLALLCITKYKYIHTLR